jgi:hypothetical protein
LQNDEKIFFRLDDDDDEDEGEKVIYCLMLGLGLVGWLVGWRLLPNANMQININY